MYCLFCVVLCIVCVYMCTELLPSGDYPIAVKYIILYRSEELFVSYAEHCDMMSIEPFSAVLHALYGPLMLYVPPALVHCILYLEYKLQHLLNS